MDGCGLKKICFIYRYYHTYLHKFRFVEMILPQPAEMRKDGRGGGPLRPFIGC